ncbi:hypothetical protein M404DRAFT_25871 [Pisolithus tinctorius Marx 270]|uniref:Uncharacterized protein n=1 Tax=Pisolithus tinctorius Marx 270 TaxID=870435 RepID=A0A0C3J6U7_PISTI|nr:hypothetical protein M404DRAFT_25871 [Pisolithus tinctorius Marx 270]
MSFLPSAKHPLAADLWPENVSSIIQSRTDVSSLQQWECFPRSLEHMVQWAAVARDPASTDKSRSHMLVYKTLSATEQTTILYPISVRVYGYLHGKFALGDVGDWDGDVNKVSYAMQHLTLSSGGHSVAWQNQLDRLNLAANFASRTLKLPLRSVQFHHRLYLQRKVFFKCDGVRLDSDTTPQTTSPTFSSQCPDLPAMPGYPWKWNGAIELLAMDDASVISRIHEISLAGGDLVEVDAEFNLVISCARSQTACLRVFLTCKQVLHLQEKRSNLISTAPTLDSNTRIVKRMRTTKPTVETASPLHTEIKSPVMTPELPVMESPATDV